MAERNNANCSICNKGYYLCISCKDSLQLNPYKRWACSPVHYQVHQVIRGFLNNVYTKDEAKEKMNNINLFDIETFKPNIKQIVKDILKEDEVVDDIKVESATVKETPVYKNVANTEKVNVFNKKNYKTEIE